MNISKCTCSLWLCDNFSKHCSQLSNNCFTITFSHMKQTYDLSTQSVFLKQTIFPQLCARAEICSFPTENNTNFWQIPTNSCKFLTEKITGAQNFNFGHKFPEIDVFSFKFCISGWKISNKKYFSRIFGQSKIKGGGQLSLALPLPQRHWTERQMVTMDGGYDSIDHYASANMWQLQDQNRHFGAIDPWPFDP